MGTTESSTRRISFYNSCELVTSNAIAEDIFHEDSLEPERNLNHLQIDDNQHVKEENNEMDLYQSRNALNVEAGDDYWTKRIDYLQKSHHHISEIIETEYEKGVQNTNKLFQRLKTEQSSNDKITTCLELQAKVLKCYQDNPHHTLICSNVVEAFNECVAAIRNEE